MMMRGIVSVLGAFAVSACSGSAIDVGPGAIGGSGSAPGASGGALATAGAGSGTNQPGQHCTDGTPLPVWPSRTACAGTNDLPLVGSWRGYIENQPPPWDEISLTIEGANSSGLCGSIKFGNDEAPPPATDPNLDYPPGAHSAELGATLSIPGSALTLLDGTTDGTRVRFRVAQAEAYESWCRLQTPYGSQGGTVCGCLPLGTATNGAGSCTVSNGSTTLTVDCGKARLCGATAPGACVCNSSVCAATRASSIGFDLRFTGDTAEGSGAHFSRVH